MVASNTIFDMSQKNSDPMTDTGPVFDREWEAALDQIEVGRLRERAGWITYSLSIGAIALLLKYDDAIGQWASKMFGIAEIVAFYLSLGLPWAFFTMRDRLYRRLLRRAWRNAQPWHKQ
jgi:hypothetical protein